MNIFIIFCFIILIIIIIFLIFKIIFINKSLKNISKQLNKKMVETNNLITISTNNKNINNLANELNKNLKRLHEKENQYNNGNKELYKSITNISHDLRTPLTAIRGYIDLLKKEKDYQKIKNYINIIDNKSLILINLTDQLFDYSKSLDLKDLLNLEKICINNLLEEVILSYYALFKAHKLNPKVNICHEKVYKIIDRTLLIRIFENILSNAFKYADKEIYINMLKDGTIIFSNKTKILDSVSVKKMFDRYFTVENGKRNSGVGLSIAKQLIDLCGGQIKANYKNNYLIIKLKI